MLMAANRRMHLSIRVLVLLVVPTLGFLTRHQAAPSEQLHHSAFTSSFVALNSQTTSTNVEFRAPKVADIDAISNLLVDCFETELKWFEFPEKENRRQQYRDMLQKSFMRRLENNNNNNKSDKIPSPLSFMVLASQKDQIVGFVQVGSLPPPPGFTIDDNDNETKQDVPYIANLCVQPSLRQGGVGEKLVDVCLKWLQKRGNPRVFIAVDYDNFGAKKFYQRNGFQWIEPPGGTICTTTVAKRDYYYRTIDKD